jgi:hypothetical protein
MKQVYTDHANTQSWNSVFSAIDVIVNRQTPQYRDAGGRQSSYDLLVTAGTYKSAYFDIMDLGIHLEYNPGTVVAIAGKMLRHGIIDWTGGERICYMHYMRNNVHNHFNVEQTRWVKEE